MSASPAPSDSVPGSSGPPHAINRQMSPVEWGLILFLSVLWGGSFFFNVIAIRELPPFTIVMLRVGIAAGVLLLIMRASGLALPRERSVWGAFLVMSVFNNLVPFTLIVLGQTQIASGLASILNATTPLFTVLIAHACTQDERLDPAKFLGVLVGIGGVAVMVGGSALTSLGGPVWAQLACLAASLSYAATSVYARRFRRLGVHPVTTTAGQTLLSTLLIAPVVVIVDKPWLLPVPSAAALGAVLALALLSTILGYFIYFRILGSAGATNIGLVTLLVPVTAVLLGIFLLGETLYPKHMIGMGLIALGLAAIDGRIFRLLRRR
jgi:drug/metabolite transporter (DMT)-like permease